MELFSLGIGNYTEKDVREAARSFTGWEIQGTEAVFNAARHDAGEKTVLGQTGKWNGDDVVRICLEQKSAPGFIVRKLYRFLISEDGTPPAELVEPLAEQFRKSGYNFGALVKTVLSSNLFFSDTAYRKRIKPPVDFALGIVRGLEGHVGTAPGPGAGTTRPERLQPAVGEGLGRRADVVERPDAAVPAKPGPGAYVHRRTAFRRPYRPGGVGP